MSEKCDICGSPFQKVVANPTTKYCAFCDKVYKVMPMDAEPVLVLMKKAVNKKADDKEAFGRYQAFRATIDALEKGNFTKLEKLAKGK